MDTIRKELWVIESAAALTSGAENWSRIFGVDGQLLAFDTEERANFWVKQHKPSGRSRTRKYEEVT
jgi:hypothetical protein